MMKKVISFLVGTGAFLLFAHSNYAADGTWSVNATGNWSDIANWNGGIGPVADGATFTAYFDAALSADRTITLDSSRTIGNLSFLDNNGGSQRFTLSGTNTLTLNADGSGGGTSLINVSAGTAATIGGSSLVLAGSSNIEKTGAGSLTLNTSNSGNTFTGSVLVSGGTLSLAGTTTAQTALQGRALTLGGGSDNVTFSIGSPSDGAIYSIGSTTVAGTGSGNVTFSYTGGTRSVISGGVTLNKNITVNSTNGPLAFSGVISGTGAITKTGSGGTLQLNAVNTYSGGTTLSQGTIRLENAGGLGSGLLTIGDTNTGSSNLSLLFISGTGTTSNNIHVTNNGTGSVTINTNNAGGSGTTKTLSGGIQIDRELVIAASGNTNANTNISVSGVISGNGSIRTSSLSNTRVGFSGANTYTGGTTISGGTLRTANASALGTGQVTFHESNTATLDLNNTALGVQSLSGGSSASTVLTGGTSGVLTLSGANVSAASFAGVISGTGSLIKNGSGTQILTGNSTYTGTTTVNGGTLLIQGNLSSATGTVTVATGGALGGDGTLGGSLFFAAGADFVFSLTETLTVNGASVSFGGFGVEDLFGLDSSVALGTYTLIDGSALFDFTNVSNFGLENAFNLGGGKLAYFESGSLNLVVAAIPEPSTYALFGLGLGALWLLRRGRKTA